MKIRDYAYFTRGVSYRKGDSRKTYESEFVPILRANNLVDNRFCFDDLIYVPKTLVDDEQMIFKDDIVITMSSGSKSHVGKIALATRNIEAGFGAFCGKLKPFNIYPAYLAYLLQSQLFRNHIEQKCKGTNINNIRQNHILDFDFDPPPRPEQDRIVARIEELFSQLDAAVVELNAIREKLQIYRQAVLKEAFECASNSDRNFCSIDRLLSKSKRGMTTGPFGTMLKKEEHQRSGVPVLGIENIGTGCFCPGNKIFITEEKAKELEAFKVVSGDIIISRSGTVGEICAVPDNIGEAYLSTNLIRISLDNSVIRSDYFVFLFQSKGVVLDQVKEICKGSTRIFLNQTILKQIKFPVPSLEIQKDIVEKIEYRLSACKNIDRTIDTALQHTTALRQSILKQAFEGNL